MKKLTYDEWYDINEDRIFYELAESGADREMDFNPEQEFGQRYVEYLKEWDDVNYVPMKNLKSSRYRSYEAK